MAALYTPPANYIGSKWCGGCGHGIFTRLIHEVLEEKGLAEKNICMNGVGCSANYHNSVTGGNQVDCHHGRAVSTAVGAKSMLPDICVWTYQGDGDAYAIGMGETIITAQQGWPVTVFVINNCNYGMTGGQAAPTTLLEQVTTTTPQGNQFAPFESMSALKTLSGVGYLARGSTHDAKSIRQLKKYISKAIDCQMIGHKYALVEILSPCPTNWHKTAVQSADWVRDEMTKVFPLGEYIGGEVEEWR